MSKHKHRKMKENLSSTTQPHIEEEMTQGSAPTENTTQEIDAPTENNTDAGESEAEELRRRCDDLADKNLRMMAEFDNYRRRTNKEKLELMKTAGENIFKDMLPLIDDFERARQAMQHTEDIASLREGIDLIYQKFIGFLEKNDIHAIATENADFDTEYHEAVTTFPAPTEEQKGKVIDCTQKGYRLGEKVIRYAKVVVGE